MKSYRVFYSWQSDSPAKTNLNAIRGGLKMACKRIEQTQAGLKLIRDEATRDTSGGPNIALKILEKIEMADVFVADITTVTTPGAKRPCANPNVGYELGYAVATLGWDRVILLFNTACGEFPNDLPFDIIQNRASPYLLAESDPKEKLAPLTDLLRIAVSAVISKNPKRPAELRGLSREKLEHDHDVGNIKWMLNSLHLPTLDQLIQELPHMIVDRALWFYDNFRGVVENSLFSLYDKGLEEAIGQFFRAWTTVLSHSGQYHELRSGHAHVFSNPFDMPLPPEREAIWNEIDVARREMRSALDTMLDRIRSAYITVKIRKTNKRAWEDYLAFRREVEELDRPGGPKSVWLKRNSQPRRSQVRQGGRSGKLARASRPAQKAKVPRSGSVVAQQGHIMYVAQD
jgi:hypothetical protein